MKKKGNEIVLSQQEYDKLVKNMNWLADIVINGHDNAGDGVDFEADADKARSIKRTLKVEEDTEEPQQAEAV